MSVVELPHNQPVAATRALGTKLFVSLELSRSTWLVTSLSPGSDKMSKHTVAGGDGGHGLILSVVPPRSIKAVLRSCSATAR